MKIVFQKVDTYTEYLKAKYGNIMIQNVGSDQKSMDSLGTGTYGMNNIVIAPNVLETMANDPKKAAYYEKMIQDFCFAVNCEGADGSQGV